jgi:flagellar basal body-associated protein FliL
MDHEDKPRDNKAEAKGFASIAKAIHDHAAATRPESSEKLDNRQRKQNKIQKAAVAIQIAAVVVAGIYVGLTLLLWRATKAAVNLTREQVHTGQRAYIIVEHPTFTQPLAVNQQIKITIEIRNTGQTPALQMRSIAVVDVLMDEPGTVTYATPETVSNLGAGQTGKAHAGRVNRLTDDEFNQITSKDEFSMDGTNTVLTITRHKHVYVYGKITYKDVFGGDGETEFCTVYIASEGPEGSFVGCKSHHSIK